MDALRALAQAAGVQDQWIDAFGVNHAVEPDSLKSVLTALGLAADGEGTCRESLDRLTNQARLLPPLVTAVAWERVALPANAAPYELTLEDGRIFKGQAEPTETGCQIPAILEPGYHQLVLGTASTTLAVAPPRCVSVAERLPNGRGWGLAVQLYSLRRPGDGGLGDFAALADFATKAAHHGADLIAISPIHAQFSARVEQFSPYSPSSRIALNILHANLPGQGPWAADPTNQSEITRLENQDLVDWPAASRLRLAALRAEFATHRSDRALAAFRAERGDAVESHARFETLQAHFLANDPKMFDWRSWPAAFHDPFGPAVANFCRDHAEKVAFHAYAQFAADQDLAKAHEAARAAGMKIGLVTDLAVGTDPAGSQGWSRPDEMLPGLSIGCPPDLLARQGQSWGLTPFSPLGLRRTGFAGYLHMLRSPCVTPAACASTMSWG